MLYHILGTDMTAITGLQPNTVLQIIAEVNRYEQVPHL